MPHIETVLVVQHIDGFGEVFVALLDDGFALLELCIFGGRVFEFVSAEEVEGESATFGGGSGLCHRWFAPAVSAFKGGDDGVPNRESVGVGNRQV